MTEVISQKRQVLQLLESIFYSHIHNIQELIQSYT